MYWKLQQNMYKVDLASFQDRQADATDFVKKLMVNQLAGELLKTITISMHDPKPGVYSARAEQSGIDRLGDAQVTFTGEVVHLPIEQWAHIKQMLHLLETSSATKRIVATIIDEVENK